MISELSGGAFVQTMIVVFGVCDTGEAAPMTLADARLIAAAPDLLAALKGMLDQPETPEAYNSMIERAQSAIAKAEGQ